jgi:translation initiation factor IF-2
MPEPVAKPVAAPVAELPAPVAAQPVAEVPVVAPVVVAPQQPAPRIRIEDIGKAIEGGEQRSPSQTRRPTLVRMKMPEMPVAPPKPVRPPQPEVQAQPVQAAPVDAPPREGAETVDAKGNRGGRKVIYDRRRDAQATGGADARGRGKKKGGKAAKGPLNQPAAGPTRAEKRNIRIEDTITVANLAATMSVKSTEVIRALFQLGVMATVNQPLDLDTVELVAGEFGFTVENVGFDLDQYLQKPETAPGGLVGRSPVVTVMGHVDHGKTSLLDAIRKTHTAAKEAGGITQHIGAYVAQVSGSQFADGQERRVVFLDTPGHEAFSAMRARGAKATDVIVLVVAADDGVMPQTIEALNHGKAAKVPIIVAVNKIDKPGADLERVRRELADHGIMSEDWGGEAIFCEVSAKTGQGIDKLLEMLALQADVLQLEANPDSDARGLVIESRLEKGRGPVATLLVQHGTLKKGQYIVAGSHYCRVRAMLSDLGKPLEWAGPSTPVEVIGFDHVTVAGDEFYVVADEKKAKAIVDHRVEKTREKELLKTSKRTLEDMFGTAGTPEIKELNLIIKADVHGSAEALKAALSKIEHEEVKVRVLHAAVGGVTESDINLAGTTKGAIIAFNVKPEAKGKRLADDLGVQIRQYSVIYDAIDDVTLLLEGMLTPIIEEVILGHAEVRQVFSVPKLGTIAGSNVLDGVMQRNQKLRVLRGKEIVHEGEFASLKRFKDDVKEVAQGYDCGIGISGFAKFQIGDKVECYELRKIARKLKPEGQSSRGA